MRIINLIVVHCTATQGNRTLSPEALDLMHRRRGFNGTGYHYYIRKDGTVHLTRPVERIGAHAKGFVLFNSIYVSCYYNHKKNRLPFLIIGYEICTFKLWLHNLWF